MKVFVVVEDAWLWGAFQKVRLVGSLRVTLSAVAMVTHIGSVIRTHVHVRIGLLACKLLGVIHVALLYCGRETVVALDQVCLLSWHSIALWVF